MNPLYLKRNVPTAERALRLAAAAALAFASWRYAAPGWLPWLGLASAAGLGATALVGFCPACAMMGRRPLQD